MGSAMVPWHEKDAQTCLPQQGRITVRSWHPEDTAALDRLVSQTSSFTRPSRYVLDVLSNSDPGLNLVATLPDGRPIAYILAFRSAANDIFIWQVASERADRNLRQLSSEAVAALFEQFRRTISSNKVDCIQFSTVSDSRTRWAAKIVRDLFGVELRDLHFRNDGERAYEIRLDGENPSLLSDIYTMPGFSTFVRNVFTPEKLSRDWLEEIARLRPGDSVLEIGAGDGRITKEILKTGAAVTAVEPSPEFCPWLSQIIRERGLDGVRVIQGYFPNIPRDLYSHVLVHQNVFLEIANQMDHEDLLAELRQFVRPGGKLLFDYISDPDPGTPRRSAPIYAGHVPGVGEVNYEREFMGYHWGMRYEVLLRFGVEEAGRATTHQRRIEVRLVPLDRILRHVGTLGGECVVKEIDAFTFFPAKSNLIEAKFVH